MNGFEIALVTIITTGFATIGLQKWYCSKSTQNETSKDDLDFNLNELTIENGDTKLILKGMNFKINESDKSNIGQNETKGEIGDKDVSMAVLKRQYSATIQTNSISGIKINTHQNHDPSLIESHLQPDGPRGTHEVQDNGRVLKTFATALITFITSYTQDQLSTEASDSATHQLLGQNLGEEENPV